MGKAAVKHVHLRHCRAACTAVTLHHFNPRCCPPPTLKPVQEAEGHAAAWMQEAADTEDAIALLTSSLLGLDYDDD